MSGFDADYRGIGQLLRSPQMQAGLHRIGAHVRDAAIAAVNTDTGNYAESLRKPSAVRVEARGGPRRDRAVVHVVSDDPGALSIEYGTNRNSQRDAQRPLRKGLESLRELR